MSTVLPNLRDLAGTPTTDGGVVAPGRLLRSALPFSTDLVDGIAWPPDVVIDLRSPAERERVPTIDARRGVNLPLLGLLAPGAHLDGTLVALYRALLDSAAHLLVDLVHETVDAQGPVLVHCAAGKDRTGISVALLLRLVGVERSLVLDDYQLTDAELDAVHRRLEAIAPPGEREALPREYFHVVPDAIDAVMDVWDAHDGGTRGWLEAAGAPSDLVDRLREVLVVRP